MKQAKRKLRLLLITHDQTAAHEPPNPPMPLTPVKGSSTVNVHPIISPPDISLILILFQLYFNKINLIYHNVLQLFLKTVKQNIFFN